MPLETVNITVNDGSNPVPGVKVTLYREGQGFFGTAVTNNSGVASFSGLVSPGVIGARVNKDGYRSPRPDVMFTVPDTGGVTPYGGTVSILDLGVEKPSQIAYCTIYGYVVGEDASAFFLEVGGSGNMNFIEPGDRGSAVDSASVFVGADKRQIRVEPDGSWAVDLPRGAMARISCLSPRFSKTFRVPTDKDAVQIKDLRGWLTSTDNISLSESVGIRGDGSTP